MLEELEAVSFLSVYIDCSNRREIKLAAIVIRYFSNSVHVRILHLGETSDIMSEYIMKVLKKHRVDQKIMAFRADNTNSNVGVSERKGQRQYFPKYIRSNYRNRLFSAYCAQHCTNGLWHFTLWRGSFSGQNI